MPLNFLYLVLRSRIFLILFVMLGTVALTAYFSSTQPNRYVATATLLLNFVTDNPFDDSSLPPQLAASYMATQVDIIASRNVALQVIEQLQLANSPEEQRAWTIELLANLEVEPSSDSRLIAVSYTAGTAEDAALFANAFAKGYATVTQNLAVEPSKRNAERFDVQIELMRSRLAKAQSKLTAYQQENGIVALDEKLDTETTRLHNLSDELLLAQADVRDVRARQLGINHPDYARAVRGEASLSLSVDDQKNRVLELKLQRDQLGVLAREVLVEQQTYETALQGYYDEQMRSSFGHAGVDVLDPAVAPMTPDTPKVALNIFGGFLLGTLLGILLAIGVELLSRRLRSPENVEEMLDTRLLNTV